MCWFLKYHKSLFFLLQKLTWLSPGSFNTMRGICMCADTSGITHAVYWTRELRSPVAIVYVPLLYSFLIYSSASLKSIFHIPFQLMCSWAIQLCYIFFSPSSLIMQCHCSISFYGLRKMLLSYFIKCFISTLA